MQNGVVESIFSVMKTGVSWIPKQKETNILSSRVTVWPKKDRDEKWHSFVYPIESQMVVSYGPCRWHEVPIEAIRVSQCQKAGKRIRFPSPAPLLHPSFWTVYRCDKAVGTLILTTNSLVNVGVEAFFFNTSLASALAAGDWNKKNSQLFCRFV